MLALFVLIFIVLYLKKDFKKNIKVVGIFFAIVLITCAICYKSILTICDKFAKSFSEENFINSLLTNRDVIWKKYLAAIFSRPTTTLFGHGLLSAQINIPSNFGPTETHNFYIFLLYRFGILGSISLGYIVYQFIKELGYKKPELFAFLPTIYILLESLCDNTMKCYNFTYFLFAIMILFVSQKDKSLNGETSQKDKLVNATQINSNLESDKNKTI
jgi:O-antigen ligase